MAVTNVDNPSLPANCEDYTLPTGVAADPACYTQQNLFGPGRNLYWSKTPFTATPTLTSVQAKLAAPQGGGEPDMIGPIVGEYAYQPGDNSVVRNNSRDVTVPGDLAWTVKITDITDGPNGTREMARLSQNGGLAGHFYIVDMNNKWHGGQNGICEGNARMYLRGKVPTGETDFQTIEGSIKGQGLYDAKVIDSPVPVVF